MQQTYFKTLWRLCLVLLFWNSQTIAFAQPERQVANHWYFSNQYGLDFSSGAPQVDLSSALFTYESSSTMSDKAGNLLFYTNGGGRVDNSVLGYIWNRNHEVMEGGALGGLSGGGYSAAQGALSLKKPGTNDEYYLFTIDELETMNNEFNIFPEGKGLSYFEIDMSANAGLGKVTVSNEKLLTPAFEHMAATKHGNCEDYWLLTRTGHGFLANDPTVPDSFYLFKISELGIDAPMITAIPDSVVCVDWQTGAIKIAPDGSHFTCGAYLFDFDKNSGAIGGFVDLANEVGINPEFPLAFSPDGRLLHYFEVSNEGEPTIPIIKFRSYQYEVATGEIFYANEISYTPDDAPVSRLPGTPQLGPDGKLYIPLNHGIVGVPTRIYVVDYPNEKGLASNFHGPVVELSPPLNGPFLRFGNFTDHIFYVDSTETIDLQLQDDVILSCEDFVPFTVSSPAVYDCMLWSTGDTTATIEIPTDGTYWLEVANGCDIGRDTFEVIFENELFDIELGNDTMLCQGMELLLLAEVLQDADYIWQDSTELPFLYVEETGTYWVEVRLAACYAQDTISIDFLEMPEVDIGSDTLICQDSSLILDASGPDNWTFEWQDGSDSSIFVASDIGFYEVIVSNDCGVTSDEIFVNLEDCSEEEECENCEEPIDCSIDFPNAFSPNGDGYSDIFGVVTDCAFAQFKLKILNRWGQMVFEGNSFSDTWDGTHNGKTAAADVYFYLVEYETINSIGELRKGNHQGDLTLIK